MLDLLDFFTTSAVILILIGWLNLRTHLLALRSEIKESQHRTTLQMKTIYDAIQNSGIVRHAEQPPAHPKPAASAQSAPNQPPSPRNCRLSPRDRLPQSHRRHPQFTTKAPCINTPKTAGPDALRSPCRSSLQPRLTLMNPLKSS